MTILLEPLLITPNNSWPVTFISLPASAAASNGLVGVVTCMAPDADPALLIVMSSFTKISLFICCHRQFSVSEPNDPESGVTEGVYAAGSLRVTALHVRAALSLTSPKLVSLASGQSADQSSRCLALIAQYDE
jgi:hypothetical protein